MFRLEFLALFESGEPKVERFFFVPIITGIVLGVLFPFQSISLVRYSSLLLFLLMYFNGLSVTYPKDKSLAFANFVKSINSSLWTLFLLFVFFPVCNAAIAHLLLTDQDLIFGFIFSTLAPVAIVVPFFAQVRGGDVDKSLSDVVLSTLLCPLILVGFAQLLSGNTAFAESRSSFSYLLAITIIPILLSWGTQVFTRNLATAIRRHLPWLNSICLALLLFILCGSSLTKLSVVTVKPGELLKVVALFLWLDLGTYLVLRKLSQTFIAPEKAESLALSLSLRNLAIPAGTLLFFHSRAALVPAIGLCIHAFFFQWLLWTKPSAQPTVSAKRNT